MKATHLRVILPLAALGAAVWLTAAVLTALSGAGVMVAIAARQIPIRLYAWLIGDWAAGRGRK